MLSVSQIARQFGLSRTTILYYESCGLLKPALRTRADYRRYGDKETRVLEQICLYRSVGLSVARIRAMLSNPETDIARRCCGAGCKNWILKSTGSASISG